MVCACARNCAIGVSTAAIAYPDSVQLNILQNENLAVDSVHKLDQVPKARDSNETYKMNFLQN